MTQIYIATQLGYARREPERTFTSIFTPEGIFEGKAIPVLEVMKAQGRVFDTQEECENYLAFERAYAPRLRKMAKIWQFAQEYNGEWVPDWSNPHNNGYVLLFDDHSKEWFLDYCPSLGNPGVPVFKSIAALEDMIAAEVLEHGKGWDDE